MNTTKLAAIAVTGGLWIAASTACDVDPDAAEYAGSGTPEDSEPPDDTEPSDDGEPADDPPEPPPRMPSGDEDEDEDSPMPACESRGGCFAWCGARLFDGRCYPTASVELDAEAFGPVLCDPLVLDVEAGEARVAEGSTNDDVRCFLRVLRYGHAGVAELYWRDTDSPRAGHLVVDAHGTGYARLELTLEGDAPACGEAIALSAPAAHLRAEREPFFDACLDTSEPIDITTCVLGPAATFFTDHDFVFDVAFPWLSGTCGVGQW